MGDAFSKGRIRTKLGIGMDLVIIPRQTRKGDDIALGDGSARADKALANFELFKIQTAGLVSVHLVFSSLLANQDFHSL
jgi:hypothetical protein